MFVLIIVNIYWLIGHARRRCCPAWLIQHSAWDQDTFIWIPESNYRGSKTKSHSTSVKWWKIFAGMHPLNMEPAPNWIMITVKFKPFSGSFVFVLMYTNISHFMLQSCCLRDHHSFSRPCLSLFLIITMLQPYNVSTTNMEVISFFI